MHFGDLDENSRGRFLTNIMTAPPFNDEEKKRRDDIKRAIGRNNGTSVDDAIHRLERELEEMDAAPEGLANDPAVAALAALRRVKAEQRKAQFKRTMRFVWAGMLLLIGFAVFFIARGVIDENMVWGRYTVPKTCMIPFGKDEIKVTRNTTYPTRTLFGYQLTNQEEADIQDEVTLTGDVLTILGADNRITEKNPTGKWWRLNYGKGEFGTAKLPYADSVWLVGSNEKTALIQRSSFCK